jgi:hypothetical protein
MLRGQVEWHHHGTERPQILDPGRLFEKRCEAVISKNKDRMLRHVAREYHGVRPRLVRLVRDAVKCREVEHVPWSGGHDPIEAARLHGVKQTIEVAKALRQRRTRENIGSHGGRCVHARYASVGPSNLPLIASRSNLTNTLLGTGSSL